MNSAQEASWGGGSGWSQGVAEHGRDDPQEQLARAREQSFREQSAAAVAAQQAAAQFAEQQRQDEIAATVAQQAAIEQQRALERNRLVVPAYQQQVAGLEQLQRDLLDIERRQAQALPFGVPAYFNFAKRAGLSSLAGQMLGGGELSPADLAARQSQVIRDPLGRAVGFASPSGSLLAGTDPYAPQREAVADMYRDDRPEVVGSLTDSETGEERCPTGYMFDEDLQACRLDTGMGGVQRDDRTDGTSAYARMGLLDVAPDFSGSVFGAGDNFEAANLAFRRGSATRPDIFRTRPSLEGYTLLS